MAKLVSQVYAEALFGLGVEWSAGYASGGAKRHV